MSDMELPARLTWTEIEAAFKQMMPGFVADLVREVRIVPNVVEVTYLRKGADGRVVGSVSGEIGEATIRIPITRSPDEVK